MNPDSVLQLRTPKDKERRMVPFRFYGGPPPASGRELTFPPLEHVAQLARPLSRYVGPTPANPRRGP